MAKSRHQVTLLDIKTDLQRALMASFSSKKFDDVNVKTFLANAEKNLAALKDTINKDRYKEVEIRLRKAKDTSNAIKKRREDLLTASYFL
jgi:hypothetical protein